MLCVWVICQCVYLCTTNMLDVSCSIYLVLSKMFTWSLLLDFTFYIHKSSLKTCVYNYCMINI